MIKIKKKYYIYILLILVLLILIKNPYEMSNKILEAPNLENIFGTDDLGRDIYSRLFIGTINSIIIVLISVGLCSLVGNIIGLITGYFGGIIDYIFQTIIEVILSIPSILIAVSVVVIVRKPIISLILSLFLIYLPLVVNYARGLVIKEKSKDYIIANKTYGVGNIRIIIKHIFPNVKDHIYTNFAINFSKGILTEAGLGFLGIGLDPSIPTLGNMLNASQSYFIKSPWFTIFPGIVIIIIVYYVRKKAKDDDKTKKSRNI